MKALVGLQGFIQRFQEAGQGANENEIEKRLGVLGKAYLHAYGAISRYQTGTANIDGGGISQVDDEELNKAQLDCLQGFFIVYHILSQSATPLLPETEAIHHGFTHTILSCLFPYPSPIRPANMLSSVFTTPARLISSIQESLRSNHHHHHHHHHSKPQNSSTSPNISQDGALHCLSRLDIFISSVSSMSSLSLPLPPQADPRGPTTAGRKKEAKARLKKQMEMETEMSVYRPLRLVLEAKVARCELVMTMGTCYMVEIRGRALKAHEGLGGEDFVKEQSTGQQGRRDAEKEEDEEEGEREVDGLDEEDGAEEVDDVKGRPGQVDRETDVERNNDRTSAEEKQDQQREDEDGEADAVRWEELVEESLISLLISAKDLVDSKRQHILIDKLSQSDYLRDLQDEIRSTPSPTSSGPKSASDSQQAFQSDADTDADSDTNSDPDSYSQSDSESESQSSSDSVSDGSLTPLQSLFRLQDRYEEQRLAVWLSLPTTTRGGMGRYIRGENGRVGEVWDGLGVNLVGVMNGLVLFSLSVLEMGFREGP